MTGSIDDLFPPSEREVYDAAPLTEVVCEFRFPRLLSIESKPPADFQERIRALFPLLDASVMPGNVANALSLPKEILQLLNTQIGNPSPAYKFLNEDETSSVTLTSEILTISTSRYTEWREFSEMCAEPLLALADIYKPTFLTRIGLRYVDVINRAELDLGDKSWTDLIVRGVLGEFAFPKLEENVEESKHEIRVRLPDNSGSVTFRHGFLPAQGKAGISYLIDFDFYKLGRIEVQNARNTINHFNTLSGRAFRACIQPALRTALRPR